LGNIIIIKQELIQTGNASFTVKMTSEIEGNAVIRDFKYSDCNGIYPLYNSLINTIQEMENVHIDLETSDKRFASEVNGNPNKNARMLEILKNIQERQNITIDAY